MLLQYLSLRTFPVWACSSVTHHLSPQQLIVITWHLLLTCLTVARAGTVTTKRAHWAQCSELHLLHLLKGKHHYETMMYAHTPLPFPMSRCSFSAVLLPHRCILHLVCVCVCVAWWCETPVSVLLSRCFTLDTYQNIETLIKTTMFVMLGHVRSCQSKYFASKLSKRTQLFETGADNAVFCWFAYGKGGWRKALNSFQTTFFVFLFLFLRASLDKSELLEVLVPASIFFISWWFVSSKSIFGKHEA